MTHRKHKRLWIALTVVALVLALGCGLFYRVYLYHPYSVAAGAKLADWDVEWQSGMLVVSTDYQFPDGMAPEEVDRILELEYSGGAAAK